MILSFKNQFVPKILDGTKIHTIREDKHDRWHEGREIHFAMGVRTKKYNCFKKGVCTGFQDIFMTVEYGMISITIENSFKYHDQKLELALKDGFPGLDEFEDWFIPLINKSEDRCYAGKIIHWTDYRYPV